MASGRIHLTIDSRLDEVRQVRKAISGLAADAPFPTEEWARVKTCVGEAVNNAIIHAYGREPGHEVEVEVRLEPDRVVCTIADRGRPMREEELLRRPDLEYSPADVASLPERGMGRYIIHQVMDRVEYVREGGRNVLTLTKFAAKAEPKPAGTP